MAQYPIANFDWLGELPGLANEAAGTKLRKDVFANLDTSDPESLRRAANRLMASPSHKDAEMGLRLHATAQARENLAQKTASENFYYKNLPDILARQRGAPQSASPWEMGSTPDPLTPPEPTPGPDPFAGAPTRGLPVPPDRRSPAPGAEAPMLQGPPAAGLQPPIRTAALGGGGFVPPTAPESPPPSPSEAMIDQAQGVAPPPPPPGPQLAQAGSSIQQGMQVPLQLTVRPQDPNLPVGAPTRPPGGPLPNQSVNAEIAHWTQEMIKLGPKPPAGAVSAIRARLQNAMTRAEMPPEFKAYQLDRIQRLREQEPDISYQQWKDERETVKERFKELIDTSGKYTKEADNANKLLQSVGVLKKIAHSEKFDSGPGTAGFVKTKSALLSLVGNLKEFGIDVEPTINRLAPGGLDSMRSTTAMQELFNAVSNQAIYDKLGTLGNQISEGDRQFVHLAFPSLSISKAANQLLVEILERTAKQAVKSGDLANEYRHSKGTAGSGPGLIRAVKRDIEESAVFMTKDGKLTDAGKDIIERVKKIPGGEALIPAELGGKGQSGGPAPGTPQPPPATPPAAGTPRPAGKSVTQTLPDGTKKKWIELPDGQLVEAP